jgi:uncharacterized membrane protein YgcG
MRIPIQQVWLLAALLGLLPHASFAQSAGDYDDENSVGGNEVFTPQTQAPQPMRVYTPPASRVAPYQVPYPAQPQEMVAGDEAQPGDEGDQGNDESFEQALTPYGHWIDTPEYGRVWVPAPDVVGDDFEPYETGGQWDYTDYGWNWVSDWDWGWAPFHYGRWFNAPDMGWCWLPGRVWGPGWVNWRFGGGYVGWAPLGPSGPGWDRFHPRWSFVPGNHFMDRNLRSYLVPRAQADYAMRVTMPVPEQRAFGSARWNAGPRKELVEREIGGPIRSMPIMPARPGVVQRVPGVSPARPPMASNRSWVPVLGRTWSPPSSQRPTSMYRGTGSWQRPTSSYRAPMGWFHPQANSWHSGPGYRAPSVASRPSGQSRSFSGGGRSSGGFSGEGHSSGGSGGGGHGGRR